MRTTFSLFVALINLPWIAIHGIAITLWLQCGLHPTTANVAAIAEFDEHMMHSLKTFEAAPVEDRGAPYRIPSVFFGYCD